MKGKNSGAVIAVRQLINSSNWANTWISLVACGLGWFAVSKIDWKKINLSSLPVQPVALVVKI